MTTIQKTDLEHRRRRREFFIILAVIPAVILLTYLERHLSVISGDIPVPTNIFLLGLININIILLILLIFLVLRNTVKLFFETRSKVMGSRLMTKLV
ncbi:MAG: PAS domain-containing sensor histidine kinase, partial [Deltaproteobacteria bacterium]|nr:PAS domain-containing sensor histidine kinase [Deltaproteobacteria bacterium]